MKVLKTTDQGMETSLIPSKLSFGKKAGVFLTVDKLWILVEKLHENILETVQTSALTRTPNVLWPMHMEAL